MKRTVAVIAGGDSSELQISLRSAKLIYDSVDKEKYDAYVVEMEGLRWEARLPGGVMAAVDRNDFSFTDGDRRVKFDFAYITIHGTPGEDGLLQGYFDMVRVPYSSGNVLSSALTFNKYVCNQYLKRFGVRVANSVMLRKGDNTPDEETLDSIGFPCFVKPNLGGSSFGITKVKTKEEIPQAIQKAFREATEVIIEAGVEGMEVTCGSYKTRRGETVFPATEIVPRKEFFDYDAKYNGDSEEITPARISGKLMEEVQRLTSFIYELLGCRGLARADYIITKDGEIYVLEINTAPGMTEVSLVPQQIKAAGLNIKEVITDIIEDKLNL